MKVEVKVLDNVDYVEKNSGEKNSAEALAIDIGGTKLAAGRVSSTGELLERFQCPTPQTTNGDELFAALEDLVKKCRTGGSFAGFGVCGVGSGGPMTPNGVTVSPLNIPAWRGFQLRQRLLDLTGLPVAIDNDAKALALAEGWRGAARAESNYIGMVVSTGVGGGIVVDGRLVHGAAANAGHIGHVQVVAGGRRCVCGSVGCLEAEASGTAIAAITGRSAAEADEEMRMRTGTLVGRAVAAAVNLLDIRLATVAGSVALGYGDLFFDAAQAEIDRLSTIVYAQGARIVPADLGDTAPLIGAAAVGFAAVNPDAATMMGIPQ